MHKLEFFFDVSSPWTYLAFARIEGIANAAGVPIDWRPILVGGVFNSVNDTVYEQRANPHPVKGRYYVKDLQDWARFCDVKIGMPPVFPVRAVDVMRMAIAAQGEGKLSEFAWAAFAAYWGELRDISQAEELAAICTSVGLDPQDMAARAGSDATKAQLRANTEELIKRGGFGSPTIFIDETDMYFGNDRLELVKAALAA